MNLGIENRIALVAASSRGLGRAVAEELAAAGTRLVICARGEEALHQAARELREAHGVEVEAVAADLSWEEGVEKVLQRARERFGDPQILFTNTGGPPSGPFEAHDLAAWQGAVRQNLESVLLLVQGVLPAMRAAGWGRIVNCTSVAVKQPVDGLILSNSLRAAVTGMARTLANEVAADGVTVNNVLPGFTRTERLDDLARANAERAGTTEADARKVWESQIPMGRLGEPDEFAAMVAFLCSQRAAYITGTSIPVDGGWVKGLL
ncbi:MAG: SDR family oxidoreductase [Gemmatimonadales bacterium]|nr:MAG: SDR family oxidoreductase [Gemmatimonadales bacterium]